MLYLNCKNKKGRITPNGVILEKHENATVVLLASLGNDIELIPPSHTPNTKTPDFIMDGKFWEMKSPNGKTLRALEHCFRKAAAQSENIIIDLRRTSMNEGLSMNLLRYRLEKSTRVKNLLVIPKKGNYCLLFKR